MNTRSHTIFAAALLALSAAAFTPSIASAQVGVTVVVVAEAGAAQRAVGRTLVIEAGDMTRERGFAQRDTGDPRGYPDPLCQRCGYRRHLLLVAPVPQDL